LAIYLLFDTIGRHRDTQLRGEAGSIRSLTRCIDMGRRDFKLIRPQVRVQFTPASGTGPKMCGRLGEGRQVA
jgi:hypothetical protein